MYGVPAHAGLFEWSIKQQEGQRQPGQDRQVSEEDRRWFMEAMEAHSQDITKRLKDIKSSLDTRDDSDEQVCAPASLCSCNPYMHAFYPDNVAE